MSCTGTPISWLRLEQLALGELSGDQAAAARDHLEGCAACRAAFEGIGADRRSLRPLRLEVVRPRRRWLRWGVAGGGLVAAAAALLLFAVIDRGAPRRPGPSPVIAVKGGGELVVGLVRERDGHIDRSPASFAAGDRFKIAVTCSKPGRVALEPSVTQGGERFWPLGERVVVACGNNTLLPGAFAVTGDQPVMICVSEEGGDQEACVELGRR